MTLAAIAVVAASAVTVGYIASQGEPAPEQPPNRMTAAQPGSVFTAPRMQFDGAQPSGAAAVDLSAMSPREAADRLFNRVMAAYENGDAAQATQFAPMAMQAYRMAEPLDADARFHVGMIGLVLADEAEIRRQIEALRRGAADHLLALTLEYKLAVQTGDAAAATAALSRLGAVYDAEITKNLPENTAHHKTLENLRAAAGAPAQTALAAPTPPGERVFARKCASCHGPSASGGANGPPLVHKTYEPGHHADESFYRAVREGVASHHWQFGDMPPVPGVTDEEIGQIIAYVRDLQVKSGIR